MPRQCSGCIKNRSKLNLSSLVVAGESGGGNLCVATGIKANIEGWVDAIDGVYAMAPMILGFYQSVPDELLAWRENEGLPGYTRNHAGHDAGL